jgi:cell division protein FtsZ
MIQFDLPKEQSSILKVIGVGGGGGNAVNHMFTQKIDGVDFIICNTDAQALAKSPIPNRIQLGPHLTQGLGAGANPEIGRQATEESLEEIRRILEVNTKMAFITAGMGGGTGTGGGPIISKICKDLGILTVGIITTPFAYEGKKRQQQAEEGIKMMKQYVDTLLVISNDKLRHQFGNLKMKEAFDKADNVLATAAKCITDVINSTGQINVDFADVCTVMRDGGVAILGNAAASGENRAQQAIEDALNSPLLNDNDIRGAKWILININSAEGDHEFTMDEVEVIQSHLLSQAGENTDVILGLGYDNTLGDKLGITLIATGFQHKEAYVKPVIRKEEPKEEKIVLELQPAAKTVSVLPMANTVSQEPAPEPVEKKIHVQVPVQQVQLSEELSPKLVETPMPYDMAPMPTVNDLVETSVSPELEPTMFFDLNTGNAIVNQQQENILSKNTGENYRVTTVENLFLHEKNNGINSALNSESDTPRKEQIQQQIIQDSSNPLPAASGGYLARPSNIYAEMNATAKASVNSADQPVPPTKATVPDEASSDLQMQLVERDDIPAADAPLADQAQSPLFPTVEDPAPQDETEEQKRRAFERIQKLRNLSFNVNASDPNHEFENVPAYIRRNMELYNSNQHIEKFYSGYEVSSDNNNQGNISTINTFLEGKKPD